MQTRIFSGERTISDADPGGETNREPLTTIDCYAEEIRNTRAAADRLTASPTLMRLVIFDIDGTLLHSMGVDTKCYAKAVSEQLGGQISTDWDDYLETTDSGILSELLDRRGVPTSRRPGVENAVRERFVELLRQAFSSDPECCRQVAGAGALLQRLREFADVRVAIATGGWSASAKLKLDHAGIPIVGIPFATADEAHKREQILRAALERTSAGGRITFDEVIYVGDGMWDIDAAAALNFKFVGIACEGGRELLAHAKSGLILDHFLDQDKFLRHVCAG